jgi:hypothetical protein
MALYVVSIDNPDTPEPEAANNWPYRVNAVVEADSFGINQGVLFFVKNGALGGPPQLLRAFAPGQWFVVAEVQPEELLREGNGAEPQ